MRKALLVLLCISFSLGSFGFARAAFQPRGPIVAPPVKAQKALPIKPREPIATSVKAKAAPIAKAKADVQPAAEQVAGESITATNKSIVISLADQDLKYFEGTQLIGEFKISSGLPGTPTPPGEYTVLQKKPVVDYKGANYDFPNTKWNLLFKHGKTLNFYIHGAYWHHNFGHPMSHGCINVAYANMEGLYNWADVGTTISIQ